MFGNLQNKKDIPVSGEECTSKMIERRKSIRLLKNKSKCIFQPFLLMSSLIENRYELIRRRRICCNPQSLCPCWEGWDAHRFTITPMKLFEMPPNPMEPGSINSLYWGWSSNPWYGTYYWVFLPAQLLTFDFQLQESHFSNDSIQKTYLSRDNWVYP